MFRLRCTVFLLAAVAAVAIDSGDSVQEEIQTSPLNVIGLVDGKVELQCNRTEDVTWKYRAPGTDDLIPIPGLYRAETTNYGSSRLILERLQLADAGTYVCQSSANPRPFEAAGAFVVVVAFGAFCSSNIASAAELVDGDAVKMTCVVTYAAVPGVNVELQWRPREGNIIVAQNFTSEPHGHSFHSLTADVRAKSPVFVEHTCQVTVHDSADFKLDMARNQPSFDSGSRCILPDRYITVRPRGHVSSPIPDSFSCLAELFSADASFKAVTIAAAVLSVLLLAAIACIVLLTFLLLRRRKSNKPQSTTKCSVYKSHQATPAIVEQVQDNGAQDGEHGEHGSPDVRHSSTAPAAGGNTSDLSPPLTTTAISISESTPGHSLAPERDDNRPPVVDLHETDEVGDREEIVANETTEDDEVGELEQRPFIDRWKDIKP